MAKLTAAERKKMPASDFADPRNRAFPTNDATHARLAISGATRSQRAGNITQSQANSIKAQARHKLTNDQTAKGRAGQRKSWTGA